MLRFEHRYGHRPERLWRAITDGAEHSAWFGFPVRIEPVVGGTFEVTFSPDMIERGKVLEVEEPRLFVYTGREDTYHWELTGDGDGCLVVLENTVGDPGHLAQSAAGFHLALDKLGDQLDEEAGRAPQGPATPDFDDLVAHYSELRQSPPGGGGRAGTGW